MSADSSRETIQLDHDPSPTLWKIVGISADVPAGERTSRLLAQLEDAAYLPPAAWHDAIELLAEGDQSSELNSQTRPALCREIEDGLRAEIDQFTGRFFSIAPADRRAQWHDLAQRAHVSPSARARLALLKPGIDVQPSALEIGESPRGAKLAEMVLQFFPLDASSRRRLIGCLLATMFDEPHEWEAAAHRLAAVQPEMAALVPEFLGGVVRLCDHERHEARRREARAVTLAKDAEWEEDRWFDLDTPKGRRRSYWLVGIFMALPLTVVILFKISELVSGRGKQEPAPVPYGFDEHGWPFPAAKKPDATRRWKSRAPLPSGELPFE